MAEVDGKLVSIKELRIHLIMRMLMESDRYQFTGLYGILNTKTGEIIPVRYITFD
jgi:hypothetical protein